MLKLLRYLKPVDLLMAAVSLVFIIIQVWLDLRIPDYMSKITELTQMPGSKMSDIWRNGIYMLLCALGGVAAAAVTGYCGARIGASLSKSLRTLLFNKVESFSMEEINRFSTSSLITRSTNDITQVQMMIVMGLMSVIRAPIMAGWAVSKIVGKGFEWSMVTVAGVAISLTMVILLTIFVVPKFRQMQRLIDNITRVTRENLTGVRVVRAYNAEGYQEEKFELANKELTDTQLFTGRAMAIMMPVMQLMMGGMSLAIYWIGAYLINNASMALTESMVPGRIELFGNMVVFSQYSMQVIMAFMMLAMMFVMLPRATVSAKRINEVLGTKPAIIEGSVTDGVPGITGELEFKNVSFRYPDADSNDDADTDKEKDYSVEEGAECAQSVEYVLHNVSFTAKQGETVAFIGSTGSGKTTLVQLILRFFDATEGEVLIDGVNVKDYKFESLYEKIGYVPQKAVLFKGTIASNVAYGGYFDQPFTDEVYKQVSSAIQIAQSSDFVEEMEGRYDASVSQGGTNLSGGQKQRIAIARAVCRKPEIYIFDDSFSALDYKTDRVLRSTLKKETSGVTNIIVAQRIGTIMDADKIIVLDDGEVAGSGKHKELLQTCDVYREIAQSQLSEEELAS